MCAKSLQSCPAFCDPMDCSPPGSSIHGIPQVKILEWVAMPSSRRSSWLRDQNCISHNSMQILNHWTTGEVLEIYRFPNHLRLNLGTRNAVEVAQVWGVGHPGFIFWLSHTHWVSSIKTVVLSNSSTLATSCEDVTHWKRLWCWEGLGAGGEGDERGWDGWMASPTRWTWVSVNSGSWWWTGRPGVLRFMGSQRVGHDWATDLIWSLRFLHVKHEWWSPPLIVLCVNAVRPDIRLNTNPDVDMKIFHRCG